MMAAKAVGSSNCRSPSVKRLQRGSKKFRKWLPDSNKCGFCGKESRDDLGNFFTSKRTFSAHHYCLLFCSGLDQNGDDHQGYDGFLHEDVNKAVKKAFNKCKVCGCTGAATQCCFQACPNIYHLPCALEDVALLQFFGSFQVYCKQHRPFQIFIPMSKPTKEEDECAICRESLLIYSYKTLVSPCCKVFFHKQCVQTAATHSGRQSFRCPLCNDKERFVKEMEIFGIYIPHRPPSWENDDLYEFDARFYLACEEQSCLCPQEREYSVSNSIWDIIVCNYCGSSGSHLGCIPPGAPLEQKSYACRACRSAITDNRKEEAAQHSGTFICSPSRFSLAEVEALSEGETRSTTMETASLNLPYPGILGSPDFLKSPAISLGAVRSHAVSDTLLFSAMQLIRDTQACLRLMIDRLAKSLDVELRTSRFAEQGLKKIRRPSPTRCKVEISLASPIERRLTSGWPIVSLNFGSSPSTKVLWATAAMTPDHSRHGKVSGQKNPLGWSVETTVRQDNDYDKNAPKHRGIATRCDVSNSLPVWTSAGAICSEINATYAVSEEEVLEERKVVDGRVSVFSDSNLSATDIPCTASYRRAADYTLQGLRWSGTKRKREESAGASDGTAKRVNSCSCL